MLSRNEPLWATELHIYDESFHVVRRVTDIQMQLVIDPNEFWKALIKMMVAEWNASQVTKISFTLDEHLNPEFFYVEVEDGSSEHSVLGEHRKEIGS